MWRLHYSDGSTYSDSDGDWQDAPARGVLAVVVPDDLTGEVVDHGRDFYVWPSWSSLPMSVDPWGLMDVLLDAGHMNGDDRLTDFTFAELESFGVKMGRSLSNAEWREKYAEIASERKGGRVPRERPVT